jgi:hypothetical protein
VAKISSAPVTTRAHPPVPEPVGEIDVNFCKNPRCANFGVPADIVKYRRKATTGLASVPGTAYGLAGIGNNRPGLKCLLCGEHFSLKSNLAVSEELDRYWRYLEGPKASCPDEDCANHWIAVGSPEAKGAYYRHGVTATGTPRLRCRLCSATFAIGGRAIKRQRITHLNKSVLLAVTNKEPMRRILKLTGLSTQTLYGKIDFLHRQCLAFAGDRERELLTKEIRRLYVSVDRQDYMVNWSRQDDRRNIVLHAIGSADNESGYVFGMHLNFDASLDAEWVEKDAAKRQDTALPHPFRRYARVWLEQDYKDVLKANTAEKERKRAKAAKAPVGKSLNYKIEDAYDAAASREDSEVSELKDEDQKLPDATGMQIHEEYALYGHFQFLQRLLPKVEKLRFFLDQDSGMRAACFAAFAPDIVIKRADVFYVRIAKEYTVDKKRALLAEAKSEFKKMAEANPTLKPHEVQMLLMQAEIAESVTIGKWADRWCLHPTPTMSEPDKAMSWQTDLGPEAQNYDAQHTANLFLKASLHGIDNFFQRIRRSVSTLERPLLTASKNRRTWYGYMPYNPVMVEKLLTIYRVMHNFVEVGKDGKTPAMRLGLAAGPIRPEDIVYFTADDLAVIPSP